MRLPDAQYGNANIALWELELNIEVIFPSTVI